MEPLAVSLHFYLGVPLRFHGVVGTAEPVSTMIRGSERRKKQFLHHQILQNMQVLALQEVHGNSEDMRLFFGDFDN